MAKREKIEIPTLDDDVEFDEGIPLDEDEKTEEDDR